jgi:hypothetical protein
MAAVARGDVIDKAAGGSMAGITETDAQGRFTLENIPPGRYAIAAGRLDMQTYYPGTQMLADAAVLTISRDATITNINFALNDNSFGRASLLDPASGTSATAIIPVSVRVENGGKLPVTANGQEVSIMLSSTSDQFSYPVDATAVSIPGPLSGDFGVRVEGLPPSYKVKSVTYGATDITNSTFSLSAANFTGARTMVVNPATGAIRINLSVGPLLSMAVPPSGLSITLDYVPPQKSAGVRIAGTTGAVNKAAVYISGVPGTVFSDRTFEFHGVPPGRHLIAAMHPFTPQAALVVVGDRAIDNVELKRTLAQPDIRVPQAILPAGPYAPGTVIPLPRILGTAVDEKPGTPVVGTVTIENEDYIRTFPLDSSGRFESFVLFPGDYDVSLWILGHKSSTMKVTIEDKDVQVRMAVRDED